MYIARMRVAGWHAHSHRCNGRIFRMRTLAESVSISKYGNASVYPCQLAGEPATTPANMEKSYIGANSKRHGSYMPFGMHKYLKGREVTRSSRHSVQFSVARMLDETRCQPHPNRAPDFSPLSFALSPAHTIRPNSGTQAMLHARRHSESVIQQNFPLSPRFRPFRSARRAQKRSILSLPFLQCIHWRSFLSCNHATCKCLATQHLVRMCVCVRALLLVLIAHERSSTHFAGSGKCRCSVSEQLSCGKKRRMPRC